MDVDAAEQAFHAAMCDDLNSPKAIQVLLSLAEQIQEAADRGEALAGAQSNLRILAGVLGLRLDALAPEDRVLAGWQEHLVDFQS